MMTDEGQPKIAAVGYPDVSDDRQRYWAPELFKKHEYNNTHSNLYSTIHLSEYRYLTNI